VIVLDTSALMAILLGESQAESVMQAIEEADALCVSAGILAEAIIVAERRSIGSEMRELIDGLGVEVVSVDVFGAEAVTAAYRAWGKGLHPAGLNFGDCFAYALAAERSAPLLFVGEDFSRTNIRSAIEAKDV
jgi:ribonuclease VapC